MSSKPTLSGTDLLHGDHDVRVQGPEVAPSISVTTTFKHPRPWSYEDSSLNEVDPWNPQRHIYSRESQEVSTRAEKILSKINQGYALTFASGLASAHAAIIHLAPKRVAIRGGYHGSHMVIELYERARQEKIEIIDLDDEYKPGDLCWLETPVNPAGTSKNIQYYADKIHAVGGKLFIDSTFGPPPLQYPFKWGADIIMHSGTKYFGGHSDLLCGVLILKTQQEWEKLWTDRMNLGSMMGSLEAWLLLRSLRTLHLRVPRQSETATKLAQWLNQASKGQATEGIPAGVIESVSHSSLQEKDANGWEPSQQMEGGFNATFSLLASLTNKEYAALLPYKLQYFISATSLGGVESLIEHRIVSDAKENPCLVRLSIGVEEYEDLKEDLSKALNELVLTK